MWNIETQFSIKAFLFKYYVKPFQKCMFMSSFVKNQLNTFKKSVKSSIRFLPIKKDYKIKFNNQNNLIVEFKKIMI